MISFDDINGNIKNFSIKTKESGYKEGGKESESEKEQSSFEAEKIGPTREFKYKTGKGLEEVGHLKRIGGLESVYSRLGRELNREEMMPPAGARKIIDIFKEARIQAVNMKGGVIDKSPLLLIAGGFSRDLLQGKEPKDLDFATDLTFDQVEEVLIRSFLKDKIEAGTYDDFEGLLKDKINFFKASQEYEKALKESLGLRNIKKSKIPKEINLLRAFLNEKNASLEHRKRIESCFEQMERCRNGKDELLKDLKDRNIWIDETGGAFQVVRIRFYNESDEMEEYEIATFREDGHYVDGARPESVKPVMLPSEDAKRRDLTINGMFYNPQTGNVIDYVDGLRSMEEEKLIFVGDAKERINEDYSRLLRFARFFIKSGFDPELESVKAVRENAEKIKEIPPEVIKKELDKMISMTDPGTFLATLDELGLLQYVMPEIKELENCKQGSPYDDSEESVLKRTEIVGARLAESASMEAAWAVVFHNIGKPEVIDEMDLNRGESVTFVNHDQLGAQKAEQVMKKMKFTSEQISQIRWLVENHQKFSRYFYSFNSIEGSAESSGEDESIKNDLFLKFYQLAKESSGKNLDIERGVKLIEDLIAISQADSAGRTSQKEGYFVDQLNQAGEDLMRFVKNSLEKLKQARDQIDGKVFDDLGIKAHLFRSLALRDLEDAVVREEITTEKVQIKKYITEKLRLRLPDYIKKIAIEKESDENQLIKREVVFKGWDKDRIDWFNVDEYLKEINSK